MQRTALAGICIVLFLGQQAAAADAAEIQTQVEMLVKAIRGNDANALAGLRQSVVLPNAEQWFADVFGPDKGAFIAARYGPFVRFYLQVGAAGREIQAAINGGRSKVLVEPIKKTGNAQDFRDQIAANLQKPVTLYRVALVAPENPQNAYEIGIFAEVDGKLRFVGDIKTLR